LTVSTVNATAVGPYTVIVTGQDANIGNAPTTYTPLQVNVGNLSNPVSIGASSSVAVSVPFVGASGVNVTFTCAQIISGGGTPQPFAGNPYNIGCQPNPGTEVISNDPQNPTTVTVTISTSVQSARLLTPGKFFASFCMGMPAIIVLGSLPLGGLGRKRILRFLGLTLLLVALLESVGCGGNGFTRPLSNTPAGTYSILVQAKDSSGAVQSSAVIPFSVIGGS
jgi:hypothetical protein